MATRPTQSRFNPAEAVGPDINSTDPEELRSLHASGYTLTQAQYNILLDHADEEQDMSSSSSARQLFESWAKNKGEKLENKIEKFLKGFQKKYNPDELTDQEIAELKQFGQLMDAAEFKKLSPKSQAKVIKRQTLGVHREHTSGEVLYLLKKLSYKLSWKAAQAVVLGPQAAAWTLQNYPTLGGVGACAVTAGQWVAGQMLYNFFYNSASEMSHMETQSCNSTRAGGGKRRRTRTHHTRKAKRTRRHR